MDSLAPGSTKTDAEKAAAPKIEALARRYGTALPPAGPWNETIAGMLDHRSVRGFLSDPVPAGTYSGTAPDSMKDVKNKGGRNGAIGPDYFQVDVRAGWRRPLSDQRALELFLDIFNITNRANFDNPTATGVPGGSTDRRLPATYLVLTNLRGGGGFPRQALMGLRLSF